MRRRQTHTEERHPDGADVLGRVPRTAQINQLTASYEEGLLEALQDPKEAAAYLTAALEDGMPEVFLLALRDVAKARGMSRVAGEADLSRESMDRMLSRRGTPGCRVCAHFSTASVCGWRSRSPQRQAGWALSARKPLGVKRPGTIEGARNPPHHRGAAP